MAGPFTRLQLQGYVLDELQDPDAVYFTTLKVRDFLNEGMAVWCERTRQRRETTTIDVAAEQAVVDLSTVSPKVLDVLRVALPPTEGSTDEYALEYVSMETLDLTDPTWRTASRGQPTHYYRFNQGNLKIGLYPEPDTAWTSFARGDGRFVFDSLYGMIGSISGLGDTEFDSLYGAATSAASKYGALRVDYVAGSTDMSADADTPYSTSKIPPEYHDCIRDYAVARCLLMETALRQVERAGVYMARFEAKVVEATKQSDGVFARKTNRVIPYRGF